MIGKPLHYKSFETAIPYNHPSASSGYQLAICPSPSGSNKKLAVWRRQSTSPYFSAAEHDPSTDTWTVLTISGALPAEFSYDYMVSYVSSTNTAYWFDNTRSTISQLIPLTISGTTLTVGTPIDISAQIPNASAAYEAKKTRMTTNGTLLYFYNSYSGVLKSFNPNTSTWATLTSSWSRDRESYNWIFWYSDGNLYRLEYDADTTTNNTQYPRFTAYNIAGASWSILTPPPLFYNPGNVAYIQENNLGVAADPADDTWFLIGIQSQNFQYVVADDEWIWLGNGYGTSNFNSFGWGNSDTFKTAILDFANEYAWLPSGYPSYNNYIYFMGSNIITGNAFGTLPTAGVLKGIDHNNFSNYPRPNGYNTRFLFVSVDGGPYTRIDMTNFPVGVTEQNLNIKWTSSIKFRGFAVNEPTLLIAYEDHS